MPREALTQQWFSATEGDDFRQKVRPKRFLKDYKCNEGEFSHDTIKKQEAYIASYFSVSRNRTTAPAVVLQLLRNHSCVYQIVYKIRKRLRNNRHKTSSEINKAVT